MLHRAFPQLPPTCYDFLTYLESLPRQRHSFGVCIEDMPPGVWNADVANLCNHHDLLYIVTEPALPGGIRRRLPVGTPIFSVSASGAACLAEHRLLDDSSPNKPASADRVGGETQGEA